MIEIFITILIWAILDAAIKIFFIALLDIYDWVKKQFKKAIKIIRINTRNSMARAGAISKDWHGNRQFHEAPDCEPLNINELPSSLREKVKDAVRESRRAGERYCDVEVNMSEGVERMIRFLS